MINNIKKELNNIKKGLKKLYNDFKKNPKKTVLTLINTSVEIVKNNTVFFVFVITNVFIGILLRYFTIHTVENLLLIKPILADLAIVLFIGSISFILKEKNRFPYLLVMSIVLTLICIINSVYYTFYTSFVSVSLIATSRYAVQVGDAIVENVMKIQDFIYLLSPLLLIATYLKVRKNSKKENREKRDTRKMVTTLIGACVVFFFFLIFLYASALRG